MILQLRVEQAANVIIDLLSLMRRVKSAVDQLILLNQGSIKFINFHEPSIMRKLDSISNNVDNAVQSNLVYISQDYK